MQQIFTECFEEDFFTCVVHGRYSAGSPTQNQGRLVGAMTVKGSFGCSDHKVNAEGSEKGK